MPTILKPCSVPWMVSPSGGGVTLRHCQDDEPDCSVVLGGGRLEPQESKLWIDSRCIEITFQNVSYARVGPHPDTKDITFIGYEIQTDFEALGFSGKEDLIQQRQWLDNYWRTHDVCLDSKFYWTNESEWLSSIELPEPFRHYVIDDCNGYVELIATGYHWKEWIWNSGHRDDAMKESKAVNFGVGAV